MHNESLENWQGVEPNYEYICRCLRWERCVGKGAHGHCWFAIHEPTGRAIAIKTMASGPEATAEVHALQTLHAFDEACAVKHHIVHAFFVKPGVADVHNTPEFTNPAWTTIGMYFYAGGNLLEFRNALPQVRDFPLITAKAVMAQIIEAIAYCHQCGIAHGDIKAENVLLSGTMETLTATLADFSLAVDAHVPQRDVSGTSYYRAPEVAAPMRPYDPTKADCWALGILLCVVVLKQYCWDDAMPMNVAILRYAQTGDLGVDFAGDYLLEDLVRSCLQLDPKKRPAVSTLLGHPWFHDVLPPAPPAPVLARPPADTPIGIVVGDDDDDDGFYDDVAAATAIAEASTDHSGAISSHSVPVVVGSTTDVAADDDATARARAVAFALSVVDDPDEMPDAAVARVADAAALTTAQQSRRVHRFDDEADDADGTKLPRLDRRDDEFDEDGMAAARRSF